MTIYIITGYTFGAGYTLAPTVYSRERWDVRPLEILFDA
jgi:hypothetical protein